MFHPRAVSRASWRGAAVSLAGLAIAAGGMSGCGLGPGPKTGAVSLTVTRDFGSVELGTPKSEVATASETAMRQLQRLRDVETKYSGGFVQSIDGLKGRSSSGRPFDWFFFVNGIESQVGAADVTLHPGDAVWWDLRDWGSATHVPAVVGAWPHPFTGSVDGKKPATRIICSPTAAEECSQAEKALAAAGIVSARGLPGMAGRGTGLRVLVGDWKSIRTDPAAAALEEGPGSSGVYLQPLASGLGIRVLTPSGRVASLLGAGTGIIAATVIGDGLPTWIISGTDSAGVAAAVRALTTRSLEHHFAVAVTQNGTLTAAPAVASK